MDHLRGLPLSYPRATLLACALLVALGVSGVMRLKEEQDILAFLPAADADVATFKEVARRFGALRVALIGVVPRDDERLFSKEMLGRLERLSSALRNVEGVDRVVSLSTMTDLDASSGGVEIRPLVPSPVPDDAAALSRLEARALALPHVRGSIVSLDGKAALVLLFLADGVSTRSVAERARALSRAHLPGAALYFGGAPFAGQSIYDETQEDVRWLTPIAIFLFFLIVLGSFNDWLAVLLTVGTVGGAGLLAMGGMGHAGESFSVVTAMLPVILFAAGSQYAIHILGRYYLLRVGADATESARGALRIAGPPVTIAALATSIGFLSFLVMNIRPMRAFGVACAFGIFVAWLLSVTVLPAVVSRWPRPYDKPRQLMWLEDRLEGLWDLVQRRRAIVLMLLIVICTAALRYASEVTVRMEPRAFFRKGSEPALAQAFLDERFGGSQFLQVAIDGDVLHPAALRELRRLTVYARSLPGVSQVQSILDPLLLVGEAMGSGRSLPGERRQIGNLLFFLEGEPSVRTLLSEDRTGALVHLRISGEPRPVLEGLERYLSRRFPYAHAGHTLEDLTDEASWVLPEEQRSARRAAIRQALLRISGQAGREPQLPAAIIAEMERQALGQVLSGEEGQGLGDALKGRLLGVGKLDALSARLPGVSEDLREVLSQAIKERFRQLVRERVLEGALEELVRACGLPEIAQGGDAQRATLRGVVAALYDPVPPEELARPGKPLTCRISGEPLLDRGFSRAVEHNQWQSLRVALIGVFVLLLVSLRSVYAAVLCLLPAAMSLALLFGLLGLSGRPIDIGTSLVGSIVTGSGADFAMHYMWYLSRNHPKVVVRNIGPVILTTAVLLCAGLGVLMLGKSPPIRLFGSMAALGLLLSASFTFLLVPALLRNTHTDRRDFA